MNKSITTLYEAIKDGYNLYAECDKKENKTGWRKVNRKPIQDFKKLESDKPIELSTYIKQLFTDRKFRDIDNLTKFLMNL